MNVRIRQFFERLRREEAGITLAELIVAMSLSVLILTVAGSFLVSSQKAAKVAGAVSANTRVAATAMNEIGRNLRAATDNPVPTGDDSQFAFQYASATSVRFFAYVNLDSSLSQAVEVQVTLDPARKVITETKWTGTAVAGNSSYYAFPLATGPALSATPTSTRTLATSVTSTTLFTYSNGDDGVLGSPTAPVGQADLANIRKVGLSVAVGRSADDPNAVSLQNTASMPNIVMGAS
ncbi:type II secretion system protein [Curtobacterium sp. MCLR17_007]|uniref:PilW family protein n=1 Tax=Curtobacterium sp. MCLR17_007 TaxID=2175648 RepID=UPI000DA7D73A|nr:type II secretion system protein [Curtobacterium sp. MCLR17_007]WIB60014.1 type II secretion system protein [Curtobacterium sp. MCLR17_007]